MELFKNPTSEYRGAPFWSWNCKLRKDMLAKQIESFKKMGMGGFNMHARVGLDTEYLGSEFMEMVKFCVEKSEEADMYAWMYDEDKWPSGHAGGRVAKDMKLRQRYLRFSVKRLEYTNSFEEFYHKETTLLLACYDIQLGSDGCLVSADLIGEQEEATGTKWYAYAMTEEDSVWFNGSYYIDALDPAATNKFIEYTHEEYKKVIGDKFGKSVPFVFTDEPRAVTTGPYSPRAFSDEMEDVTFPWSKDFAKAFEREYGKSIYPALPELLWERADGGLPEIRYQFYRLVSKLFNEGFMKPYSRWCRENGLGFTGHLMAEDDLISQSVGFAGESMPSYEYFDLPGVDVLCAQKQFTTVKQAQSAVRQLGKEGVMSELYGVTEWDFDFRGHKLEGDWQAAMGVTTRVHHLAFLTMEGAAKRDYPASIGYQSPWYEEYAYVEDHFARLNTVLTRGKPVVKVAVVHPIESFWLQIGPQDKTSAAKESMERNFRELTQLLLFGGIDFDFISEAMLPELCPEGGNPLKVGQMEYDAVILSDLTTIRGTTLDRLREFVGAGGKLITIGSVPGYVDLQKSDEAEKLCESAVQLSFNSVDILSALEDNRLVDIRDSSGVRTDNMLYQMREDGEVPWLFCAHAKGPACIDTVPEEKLVIKIKGEFTPVLYDTITGKTQEMTYTVEKGFTVIRQQIFSHDSLLIQLKKAEAGENLASVQSMQPIKKVTFKKPCAYALSEKNVLLLDRAEYSLDGEAMHEEEEILVLCEKLKERLGWPSSGADILQPWLIDKVPTEHTLSLRYRFESEIDFSGAQVAVERPDNMVIRFNGEQVTGEPAGYFTDEAIKTLDLPLVRQGENVLELTMPFDKLTFPEWIYILGDFGVRLKGACASIIAKCKRLGYSPLEQQSMPFYGQCDLQRGD